MDEARAAGLKIAVCSAATKDAAVFVVRNLLGEKRFAALDVFLAGSDVPKLKPDPLIYTMAAEALQVHPSECIVVEDSTIGLKAGLGAGMRVYITYTSTGMAEPFEGAECVLESFGDEPKKALTIENLINGNIPIKDDRNL